MDANVVVVVAEAADGLSGLLWIVGAAGAAAAMNLGLACGSLEAGADDLVRASRGRSEVEAGRRPEREESAEEHEYVC